MRQHNIICFICRDISLSWLSDLIFLIYSLFFVAKDICLWFDYYMRRNADEHDRNLTPLLSQLGWERRCCLILCSSFTKTFACHINASHSHTEVTRTNQKKIKELWFSQFIHSHAHWHHTSKSTKFCKVRTFSTPWLRENVCIVEFLLTFCCINVSVYACLRYRSGMECVPYLSPMTVSWRLLSTPLNSANVWERQRTSCRRLRTTMQRWRWLCMHVHTHVHTYSSSVLLWLPYNQVHCCKATFEYKVRFYTVAKWHLCHSLRCCECVLLSCALSTHSGPLLGGYTDRYLVWKLIKLHLW